MEPQQEEFTTQPAYLTADTQPPKRRWRWLRKLAVLGVVVAVLTVAGFNLLYAGKIYPGVSVNGVYLGGLDRAGAITAVNKRIAEYQLESIAIHHDNALLRILPFKLDLKYDVEAAVDLALKQGQQGNLQERMWGQARAIASRPTNIALYTYDDNLLKPYLDEIGKAINQPVTDAKFNVSGSSVTVTTGHEGVRLNLGGLILKVKDRLSFMSSSTIEAPVGKVQPIVDTVGLEAVRGEAADYLSAPLVLKGAGQTFTVPVDTIASWLALSRGTAKRFEDTHNIVDFTPVTPPVALGLDDSKLQQYVATIAVKVDRTASNAKLDIQDGKAVVFKPSVVGQQLDKEAVVKAIKELVQSRDSRELAMSVKTVKPDISEGDLNDLGIKELISEGVSYFPGSTANRIINVRAGANRFNGVLIKAGETFSFNTLLGDVGPETGYVAESVILGDHVEKQYGGGLCQVSSTAFRAALNAGLPITARQNHSYAVSYYTAPYGVPGVDATIYLPNPDFKFLNDTGSAILIQTTMTGTSLKFQFYGTKTKSGQIRGPYFVTGSLDATKPSHTVFYRDVLDMAGNVVKTNTFNSYYKSSDDFPKIPNEFGN